jgi:hypothetical protein
MLGKDSPALKVNSAEALQYYSVGPPYIMTGKDAKMLAPLWAELIRKVGLHGRAHNTTNLEIGICCFWAEINIRPGPASRPNQILISLVPVFL